MCSDWGDHAAALAFYVGITGRKCHNCRERYNACDLVKHRAHCESLEAAMVKCPRECGWQRPACEAAAHEQSCPVKLIEDFRIISKPAFPQ